MSIQIKDFGKTTAGQPVKVGILANDTIEVHILSYGATIQQLLVPDRKGNKVDVVLGYPTVQDYELNTCFLGAVVGRYANRIGGSKFTLYEEEYHVTPNEGKTACTAACTALIRPCLTWALRGRYPGSDRSQP